MIKLYLKQAWDADKAASSLYRYLCGGYRAFNSSCHDNVYHLLRKVCSYISGV